MLINDLTLLLDLFGNSKGTKLLMWTVISCLVFTVPEKWRMELRAKTGHYRNRCFTILTICTFWVMNPHQWSLAKHKYDLNIRIYASPKWARARWKHPRLVRHTNCKCCIETSRNSVKNPSHVYSREFMWIFYIKICTSDGERNYISRLMPLYGFLYADVDKSVSIWYEDWLMTFYTSN